MLEPAPSVVVVAVVEPGLLVVEPGLVVPAVPELPVVPAVPGLRVEPAEPVVGLVDAEPAVPVDPVVVPPLELMVEGGCAQITVTRSPAFATARRDTAIPATGNVTDVEPGATVSRTVIVWPVASIAMISACTCAPGWVGALLGAPGAVWACATAAASPMPRTVVSVFMKVSHPQKE